jgi:hypothetical protein
MSGQIICIIRAIAVGWRIGLWFLVEKPDELFATLLETFRGGVGVGGGGKGPSTI